MTERRVTVGWAARTSRVRRRPRRHVAGVPVTIAGETAPRVNAASHCPC